MGAFINLPTTNRRRACILIQMMPTINRPGFFKIAVMSICMPIVTISIYNNTVAILDAPAFSSLRAGVKERTIPISVENNISQKKLLVKENFSSAGKWSVMYEVTGFAKSE